MTMDWTVEQIFSELQSSGERIQQEKHMEQMINSGNKFEDEFPSTADYMDDLDVILNHHDEQWSDQFRQTTPITTPASTATRTNDFRPATTPPTTVSAPTASRIDDFRQPDSTGSRSVFDNEEMEPTPSMLPYLPSPPPLQPPVPDNNNVEHLATPVEVDDNEEEAFTDEGGSNGPILLPPPMEYRDKVEEEEGPGSVFTSSSVRSLSPTSPFTWSGYEPSSSDRVPHETGHFSPFSPAFSPDLRISTTEPPSPASPFPWASPSRTTFDNASWNRSQPDKSPYSRSGGNYFERRDPHQQRPQQQQPAVNNGRRSSASSGYNHFSPFSPFSGSEMRISTEPSSPASPYSSPLLTNTSRSLSFQDNSSDYNRQNQQFAFLKSLTENDQQSQNSVADKSSNNKSPWQVNFQEPQTIKSVEKDETKLNSISPSQNSYFNNSSCDSIVAPTTAAKKEKNGAIDLNSVVAQLGVLQPCIPPPPPVNNPTTKPRRHPRGYSTKKKQTNSLLPPKPSRSEPSMVRPPSPTSSFFGQPQKNPFSQSFQHFESSDSGVESIESLSPKDLTSSPVYSPNNNEITTNFHSNVSFKSTILNSIFSSTTTTTKPAPAPSTSPTGNANPLLASLLNNPSSNVTNVQMRSSTEMNCIGMKSISIVAINPNDNSITTTKENFFEVEAVMDVTLDIDNAITMAQYMNGNVNISEQTESKVEDKSKKDLIRCALESAEQLFPTFDSNINNEMEPTSQQQQQQQTEQTYTQCAGLKNQMLEKEATQKDAGFHDESQKCNPELDIDFALQEFLGNTFKANSVEKEEQPRKKPEQQEIHQSELERQQQQQQQQQQSLYKQNYIDDLFQLEAQQLKIDARCVQQLQLQRQQQQEQLRANSQQHQFQQQHSSVQQQQQSQVLQHRSQVEHQQQQIIAQTHVNQHQDQAQLLQTQTTAQQHHVQHQQTNVKQQISEITQHQYHNQVQQHLMQTNVLQKQSQVLTHQAQVQQQQQQQQHTIVHSNINQHQDLVQAQQTFSKTQQHKFQQQQTNVQQQQQSHVIQHQHHVQVQQQQIQAHNQREQQQTSIQQQQSHLFQKQHQVSEESCAQQHQMQAHIQKHRLKVQQHQLNLTQNQTHAKYHQSQPWNGQNQVSYPQQHQKAAYNQKQVIETQHQHHKIQQQQKMEPSVHNNTLQQQMEEMNQQLNPNHHFLHNREQVCQNQNQVQQQQQTSTHFQLNLVTNQENLQQNSKHSYSSQQMELFSAQQQHQPEVSKQQKQEYQREQFQQQQQNVDDHNPQPPEVMETYQAQRSIEESKRESQEDKETVDSTTTSSSPSIQNPFQIIFIQNENGMSEFRFQNQVLDESEQDVTEQNVVAPGSSQSPDNHEDSKDEPDDMNPQTPATPKTPCKCRICGKEFVKEKNLQLHYKLHLGEKDYLCSICNKSYFTKSGLQAHQRQMHSSEDNSFFPCDHCHLFFSTRYEMNVHRQSSHENLSPERCNVCNINFRNHSELKRHHIAKHSNRPFACPHCPHRSKTRDKLERHLASHLAKESYACSHCSKKFAFKNSLKKHLSKRRCEALKYPPGSDRNKKSPDRYKKSPDRNKKSPDRHKKRCHMSKIVDEELEEDPNEIITFPIEDPYSESFDTVNFDDFMFD